MLCTFYNLAININIVKKYILHLIVHKYTLTLVVKKYILYLILGSWKRTNHRKELEIFPEETWGQGWVRRGIRAKEGERRKANGKRRRQRQRNQHHHKALPEAKPSSGGSKPSPLEGMSSLISDLGRAHAVAAYLW